MNESDFPTVELRLLDGTMSPALRKCPLDYELPSRPGVVVFIEETTGRWPIVFVGLGQNIRAINDRVSGDAEANGATHALYFISDDVKAMQALALNIAAVNPPRIAELPTDPSA